MRAALVIIFWLALCAAVVLWSCYKAGVTWGDFCRGLVRGFFKGEVKGEDYFNVGWRLGNNVAGLIWSLLIVIALVAFVLLFMASFIWAGIV